MARFRFVTAERAWTRTQRPGCFP